MTDISLRRPDSGDELLDDGLVGWQELALPRFRESSHMHPDRVGWLGGSAFENAGVAYAGGLSDISRSASPSHWSTTWTSRARIPAAPDAGLLRFRFRVRGKFRAIAQATLFSVAGWLKFGVGGDADAPSPLAADGSATPIATPVQALLAGPHARRLSADGEQVIEGSVPAEAGAAPLLAFELGADLLLQDGWAAIEPGGVSRSWIERVGAPGGVGSIEYRYESGDVTDER